MASGATIMHWPALSRSGPVGINTSMNSTLPLTGSHLRTYNRIFQHPLSHNLEWRDVKALFDEIGQIEQEPNGNLKVTRNGLHLVLHPEGAKDVSNADELMAIRHFLIDSAAVKHPIDEQQAHWLLVIDHHEARIFRTGFKGTVPEQILPHGPDKYFRHAHNSKDFSRGKEMPEHNSFFAPVADAMQTGGKILIFGTGTGEASEMEQLVAWAKLHRPAFAHRIIGTVCIDEQHLMPNQLLAKARSFYAEHQRVLA